MLKQILKIFDGDVVLFGITFCGYGLISFLVTDVESSQGITIPYRGMALLLNLFFLLKHLKIIRFGQLAKTKNTITALSKKAIIWPLLILIAAYSFRVIYTVITYTPSLMLVQPPSTYIQFWFLISLLPGLNFLFLDRAKSEQYLFIIWLLHAIIGVSILFLNPDNDSIFAGSGRLSGAALNPISLGHYATSLAITSVFIWLRTKKSSTLLFGQPKFQYLYVVTAIIGTIGMILSASRGPLVAEILCIALLLINSRKMNLGFVVATTILVGGGLLATTLGGESGSMLADRLSNVSDEVEVGDDARSQTNRGNLYNLAWKTIQKYPLIGSGIELPNGYGYPHNLLLEAFLTMGFLGGLVFLGIIAYVTFKAIQVLHYKNKNADWGWLGALFIQYLINALFSGSLYASSLFWYLLLAMIGLCSFKPLLNRRTLIYQESPH
jgi:O-antigen ligase